MAGKGGAMSVANYEDYRQSQIESARVFQDFVVDACWNILKIAVCQYSSRVYQFQVGESLSGIEIKYDKKMAESGNVYIETSEKARPRNGEFAKSGIYRSDNTWLYIIGDYDTLFVFSKQLLRGLHRSNRYREVEISLGTSTGFLLPRTDAEKYAAVVLSPKASNKIAKGIADLDGLSDSIVRSMIEHNSDQLLLNFENEGTQNG